MKKAPASTLRRKICDVMGDWSEEAETAARAVAGTMKGGTRSTTERLALIGQKVSRFNVEVVLTCEGCIQLQKAGRRLTL